MCTRSASRRGLAIDGRGAVRSLLLALLLMVLTLPVARAQDGLGSVSFMFFGDPAELAAYQGLVAAFEAEHPAIDIELVHIPSLIDYQARLGADLAAGSQADVVLINYRRYAPLAARGVLEPLAPYLRSSEVIAEVDFFPQAIEPFRWRGQLMCIPQNISSLVVYYNRDLFDAAGLEYPADDWTWDEFLAAAQALTLDLDGDGITDQYGLGTDASLYRVAPFIWQNGGELVDRVVRGPADRARRRSRCPGRAGGEQREPLHRRPQRHVPQQPPRCTHLPAHRRVRLGCRAAAARGRGRRHPAHGRLLHGGERG